MCVVVLCKEQSSLFQILHHVLAARFQVGEERHAVGDHLEIVDRERHAHLIIKIFVIRAHAKLAAQDSRHHLLGGRLSDRTGDANDIRMILAQNALGEKTQKDMENIF